MTATSEAIERAEQIQARLLAHRPSRLRNWSEQFVAPKRAALLSGPRGVGKTAWMLSQAEKSHMLYVSVDSPVLTAVPLFDLIESILSITNKPPSES